MDRPLCELYGYNEYSNLPTVCSPRGNNVCDKAYIISALPADPVFLTELAALLCSHVIF